MLLQRAGFGEGGAMSDLFLLIWPTPAPITAELVAASDDSRALSDSEFPAFLPVLSPFTALKRGISVGGDSPRACAVYIMRKGLQRINDSK